MRTTRPPPRRNPQPGGQGLKPFRAKCVDCYAPDMRVFMFLVMVLFSALAIGSVIAAIVLLANSNPVGGIIAVIIAGTLAVMAGSIGKSYRDTAR